MNNEISQEMKQAQINFIKFNYNNDQLWQLLQCGYTISQIERVISNLKGKSETTLLGLYLAKEKV